MCSTNSGVASVLQLSTTVYDQFEYVCRRTLATHSSMYAAPLYTGVSTLTSGKSLLKAAVSPRAHDNRPTDLCEATDTIVIRANGVRTHSLVLELAPRGSGLAYGRKPCDGPSAQPPPGCRSAAGLLPLSAISSQSPGTARTAQPCASRGPSRPFTSVSSAPCAITTTALRVGQVLDLCEVAEDGLLRCVEHCGVVVRLRCGHGSRCHPANSASCKGAAPTG